MGPLSYILYCHMVKNNYTTTIYYSSLYEFKKKSKEREYTESFNIIKSSSSEMPLQNKFLLLN